MKINWKIVAGLLAAGWTYDTIVFIRNRARFNKLIKEHNSVIEIMNLYGQMLQKHNIVPNDFEAIVLNNYISSKK